MIPPALVDLDAHRVLARQKADALFARFACRGVGLSEDLAFEAANLVADHVAVLMFLAGRNDLEALKIVHGFIAPAVFGRLFELAGVGSPITSDPLH